LTIILTGIQSIKQHLSCLKFNINQYRPAQCPHCGKAGLWCHGHYYRKPDRSNPSDRSLNPLPIPRFMCRYCRGSCSTLPECLSPHRWYLWQVQQLALVLALNGFSLKASSRFTRISRRTLGRWVERLKARFSFHADALRRHFSGLGRLSNFTSFWQGCLTRMSLSEAMILVQQGGIAIP
jgi:transposase-like protein